MNGSVLAGLLDTAARRGAAYWVLLDPDRVPAAELEERAALCVEAGADAILIGTSLTLLFDHSAVYQAVRRRAPVPLLTFPGTGSHVSPLADAILFLSMVSSRNPELLIGEHVRAAPRLKQCGVEVIPTAYLLIESGTLTSVQYMSGSLPIPRAKSDIAMAHALAAQFLGMKLVYLEAGSGTREPVPDAMISDVCAYCSLPVIVGGGIRDAAVARAKVAAGARCVVTGNLVEEPLQELGPRLRDLAAAVHVSG